MTANIRPASGRQTRLRYERRILFSIALLPLLLYGWLVALVQVNADMDQTGFTDAILMLGAGVHHDGTPSPALQARVDQAARLYDAGYAPLIALTGGSIDGKPAEALVAYQVLIEQGIPPDAILLEDQSQTTAQNVRYITPLLKERGVRSILLVTSPFHIWRARAMIGDAGFTVLVSPPPDDPAESQPQVRLWYVTREIGAWFLYQLFGW